MHIDSNAHTASFSALQIACRRASEQAMRERAQTGSQAAPKALRRGGVARLAVALAGLVITIALVEAVDVAFLPDSPDAAIVAAAPTAGAPR